jgi:hypothetical protein
MGGMAHQNSCKLPQEEPLNALLFMATPPGPSLTHYSNMDAT